MEAFKNLTFALGLGSNFLNSPGPVGQEKNKVKKIVLFFDEFPWTPCVRIVVASKHRNIYKGGLMEMNDEIFNRSRQKSHC